MHALQWFLTFGRKKEAIRLCEPTVLRTVNIGFQRVRFTVSLFLDYCFFSIVISLLLFGLVSYDP